MATQLGGWSSIATNPTDHDLIATASVNYLRKQENEQIQHLSSVQLYKLDEDSLRNLTSRVPGSTKRMKTDVSTFEPYSSVHIHGGVKSLQWLDS
jgi:WD40 repeat protein